LDMGPPSPQISSTSSYGRPSTKKSQAAQVSMVAQCRQNSKLLPSLNHCLTKVVYSTAATTPRPAGKGQLKVTMPAVTASPRGDNLIIREIECKSILSKSGIPGVDYALNPYVGCAHGCVYCYAVFMKRFTGHEEEWGTFVDIKINAPDVLIRQLKRAKPGNVSLGTVTDAYQPLEGEYRITRACLEALLEYPHPVSILTKSALVLRDLDLISKLKDVEVAFTITTLDEEVRRRFEPGASPIAARLKALRGFSEAGVPTWAFCGPLLPGITDDETSLDALFAQLKQAGVGYVLVDSLNLRGAVWGRLSRMLGAHYSHLMSLYRQLSFDREPYHAALMERSRRLAARHGLEWEGVTMGQDDESRADD
jgi:DNA repair photolyase